MTEKRKNAGQTLISKNETDEQVVQKVDSFEAAYGEIDDDMRKAREEAKKRIEKKKGEGTKALS